MGLGVGHNVMENHIATCTYDNPVTMARECWQDGKLICKYDAILYALPVWPVQARLYFFGANVGNWETGRLVGDAAAMCLPKTDN